MTDRFGTLTVKNYRCFTDENPLRLPLTKGNVALIGANNSGKSTALKFFHEFKGLWAMFSDFGNVFAYLDRNDPTPFQFRDLPDYQEVFTDRNDRPILICFDFDVPNQVDGVFPIKTVIFQIDRPEKSNIFKLSIKTTDQPLRSADSLSLNATGVICRGGDPYAIDLYGLFGKFFANWQRTLFIPAFRNIVNSGGAQLMGTSIGTSLLSQWNSWKNDGNKHHLRAILDLEERVRKIFGFGKLSIDVLSGNRDLSLTIDGRPYQLSEIGAGISQFIIALINLKIHQPQTLLLDEPETGLHPSLQLEYLSTLAEQCAGNVYFATHSMGLAKSFGDEIVSFKRTAHDAINIAPLASSSYLPELLGEMSFSSWNELGCEAILVVEGHTDIRTYSQFLGKLGCKKTAIPIHLGGSEKIKKDRAVELNELTRLGKPIYIVIDCERDTANANLSPDRQEFVDTCAKLGLSVHVLDRRATENYLSDQAIKQVEGESYIALGEFEALDSKPSQFRWGKSNNWKIAAQMTKEDLMATDLGLFLSKLP